MIVQRDAKVDVVLAEVLVAVEGDIAVVAAAAAVAAVAAVAALAAVADVADVAAVFFFLSHLYL